MRTITDAWQGQVVTDVDKANQDEADQVARAKADSAIELDEVDAGAEWDPDDDEQPS